MVPTIDYMTWKSAQLVKECRKRGLSLKGLTKKNQFASLLQEDDRRKAAAGAGVEEEEVDDGSKGAGRALEKKDQEDTEMGAGSSDRDSHWHAEFTDLDWK